MEVFISLNLDEMSQQGILVRVAQMPDGTVETVMSMQQLRR
jgi:hypothetical protein